MAGNVVDGEDWRYQASIGNCLTVVVDDGGNKAGVVDFAVAAAATEKCCG